MPSQRLLLKAKGLYTHPNLLSEVPEGALVVADDVVIDRDGMIQPRRGFERMAGTVATSINRLFSFQDVLLLHHNNATLAYRNGSAWTALTGSYAAPDATTSKMRAAQAARNLYLTTDSGVHRLDAYSGTPVLSGAQRPPGFERDKRLATANAAGLVRSSGTTVTATTTSAHGFYEGQVVTMTSAGEADFANGNKTVATVPTSTTFTYAESGANVSSAGAQTFAPAELATAGGFLTDGNQVAYRMTFVVRDANGNEFESAPSQRLVVANATGTRGWVTTEAKNVILRALIPSTITNNDLIRLYRSGQVATSIEPSDEMQLVWEAVVKPTEITAGYADITDLTPDAIRGATGYFAPSQEGILQSNTRPPMARDVVLFGGSLWFARTTGPLRYETSILGVGGTGGIQNGDRLAGVLSTVTFTTSTPTQASEAYIETGGSASQNIRRTAENLVAAINRLCISGALDYFAYYLSGDNDAPGRLLIEKKNLNQTSGVFSVRGKRTAWAPVPYTNGTFDLSRSGSTVTATAVSGGTHSFLVGELVTLSGGNSDFPNGNKTVTSVTSTTLTYAESGAATSHTNAGLVSAKYVAFTNDAKPHRVYYSKPEQPEAVPLLNYFDVGSEDAEVLKLAATRSSLFIFKEDGLYRALGSNGSFEVQLFDPTVILLAPDSVAVLQNQVFALTTQGVVAISDTGVEIVSRPIERTLSALQGESLSGLKNLTFGVAYESERKYLLWTITDGADTAPTQAFVYNALTDAWTRWVLTRSHGLVNPADDKLYLAETSGHSVSQERKTFTYADYADRSFSVTVGAIGDGLELVSASGVAVGDIIDQPIAGVFASVSGVNGNAVAIEGESEANFLPTTATVYKAIPSVWQYAPMVGDAPGRLKTFQDTELLFANCHIPKLIYGVANELVTSFDSTTVPLTSIPGQWGLQIALWDGVERAGNVRLMVPQGYRMADRLSVRLSVTQAWGVWALDGVGQVFNPGSLRPTK